MVAVGVDVLAGQRGNLLELAGDDELHFGAELVEDALDVDGVPGDDRVDDDRQAERLLALLIRGALTDVAFVGVEEEAAQRVALGAIADAERTGELRARRALSGHVLRQVSRAAQ